MSDKIYLEFGPDAIERLHNLMRRYGEPTPSRMVSRALGLLEALQIYLRDDGTLTVIDPAAGSDNEREVEFVFEKAAMHDRAPAETI